MSEDGRTEREPLFSRERVAQIIQKIIDRDRDSGLERVEHSDAGTRSGDGVASGDDLTRKVGVTVCERGQHRGDQRLQGRDFSVQVSIGSHA